MMNSKIKMRDFPGDIPLDDKIAMLEDRYQASPGSKQYRKLIKMRQRGVLKNRVRKEIEEMLSDGD